jgi:hypothetical protein
MRRGFAGLLGAALLLAACSSPPEAAERAPNPYPFDKVLRVNEIQVLGTHNSYHQRPRTSIPGEWTDYEHPSLTEQLGDQGLRSVELDVSNRPSFPVEHDPFVDNRSSCSPLADCLRELKRWSDAHPGHVPIFVLVDAKDPTPVIDTVRDDWDTTSLHRLDDEIRSVLEPKDLLTPDDVRGDAPTLRNAVVNRGWPTLKEARGKLVMILNRERLRQEYMAGNRSLEDRVMFIPAYENAPSAAFIAHDQPDERNIARLVRKGFIVRARADAEGIEVANEDYRRSEEAIASGAQIISTDYPEADLAISPYEVRLPNGRAVRCNPVIAPPRCRGSAVENERGLR